MVGPVGIEDVCVVGWVTAVVCMTDSGKKVSNGGSVVLGQRPMARPTHGMIPVGDRHRVFDRQRSATDPVFVAAAHDAVNVDRVDDRT
jgi:hypothetical protein